MLNHVEIQGKIAGGPMNNTGKTAFVLAHERGFSGETERFLCTLTDRSVKSFLDGADIGRTVIATGKLHENGVGSYEIVCETIDFVDGGGKNADQP